METEHIKMTPAYQVEYVSPSGHRGFSIHETLAEARRQRTELRRKRFRSRIAEETHGTIGLEPTTVSLTLRRYTR
jgi:hypothetical protein